MMHQAEVEIRLKPGHSDPEGETVAEALKDLEYPVETVRVSKVYRIMLDVDSEEEAEKKVDEMCRRLLANPTKDDYSFTIEEVR
jgi:phosphoribosylformylglycinamidine synthase PurS subunit